MAEPVHADARILIVDDEPAIVRLLTRALQGAGYSSVTGFSDSIEALARLDVTQVDLIILDINMPRMSGYDFLSDLSQRIGADTFLPVLMVSGLPEEEARLRALQAGANNFLPKPIDIEVFVAHVHSFLETRFMSLRVNENRGALEEMVRRRTTELQLAHIEILERLGKVAEYRDDTTGQHTDRVGYLCMQLAMELGLPQERVSMIARTAPLHDLGKVAIADAVLLKKGRFDDSEREVMRRHSMLGAELLSGGTSEFVRVAEEIALSHHERWDGQGYPHGQKGEEIPLAARIVAVADAFDALIHVRPYKGAWTAPEALAEIERERGRQFDPQLVDALLRLSRENRLVLPSQNVGPPD